MRLAALEIVGRQTFDVVICDVVMDGMSGLELLDRVKRTHPACRSSSSPGPAAFTQAVDAIKRGAFEYVVKPCDATSSSRSSPRRSTSAAIRSRARDALPPAPTAGMVELVGTGPAMRNSADRHRLRRSIERPRARHRRDRRGQGARGARDPRARLSSRRPFVAVNTSAIPEELLEGELFGHVRGGFTGAVQARKGLLTEADGGTLLLDEIGDMSFALQAKLLRVLQFGDVRPVGSDRPTTSTFA
jgi:DNA-binding NtrC family response regulator